MACLELLLPQVLLLVGGEHARELITAEIALWLGRLLTGTADEMGTWPAMAAATATAHQHGWAKGSLAEWGDALLLHVVFKVQPVARLNLSFGHYLSAKQWLTWATRQSA